MILTGPPKKIDTVGGMHSSETTLGTKVQKLDGVSFLRGGFNITKTNLSTQTSPSVAERRLHNITGCVWKQYVFHLVLSGPSNAETTIPKNCYRTPCRDILGGSRVVLIVATAGLPPYTLKTPNLGTFHTTVSALLGPNKTKRHTGCFQTQPVICR